MSSNTESTIGDTVANLGKAAADNLNWAASKITGAGHEAKKEAAKEDVKSSNTSIGQKIDGVSTYISEGSKEAKDKAEAEKHSQKAEYHQN